MPGGRSWRATMPTMSPLPEGAGLPCIFAAWGYGPPAMAAGAVAVAQDFAELAAIARRLLA